MFEWVIALRYLRPPKPRTWKSHWVTVVFLAGWIACLMLKWSLQHVDELDSIRPMVLPAVNITGLVCLGAAFLIGSFLIFLQWLTLFAAISAFGLYLGSVALVVAISIMSGFESDLRGKILGTNAHIVVQRPDGSFTDYNAMREKLRALPGVTGAAPFLTNEVMIASSSNLSGVVMKGIDPIMVKDVADLGKNMDVGSLDYLIHPDKLAERRPRIVDELDDEKEGKPVPPPRILPGVIVGRELSRELHLYLGDEVSLISPFGGVGPSGPIPKSKPFRVAGIFFSGMYEYDSKYVYVDIPAAQKFLNQPDEVTGIELKVKDPLHTEIVDKIIQGMLPAKDGYEVQDWKELNRSLFSALKLEKILMFIILGFICLVAAFSIVANGIMLVTEKGKEIAILKSLGAADGGILTIFLILGCFLGLVGSSAGVGLGAAICSALEHIGFKLDSEVYYITQLPVQLNALEVAAVFGSTVLIATLATLYPAFRAAQLRPVEGLRV